MITPRRLPTATWPEGVLASLTTCGPPCCLSNSSARRSTHMMALPSRRRYGLPPAEPLARVAHEIERPGDEEHVLRTGECAPALDRQVPVRHGGDACGVAPD